jgi:CRP/FNR family transcriptional regulator
VPAFQELPEESLTDLAAITHMRRFRRNALVYVEGAKAEVFCFVSSGTVKLFKTTAEGQEQTLHLLTPGMLFATTGFTPDARYPATAEAMEDTWVGCILNSDLSQLAQRDAHLSWALLVAYSSRLSGKMQHMLDLGTRDAAGRLAAGLLRLVPTPERVKGRSISIDMPVSHQELAQLIGASRETVTRLLKSFRLEGAVEVQGSRRLVLHPDVLQRHVQ